jgi:hypothetical protein
MEGNVNEFNRGALVAVTPAKSGQVRGSPRAKQSQEYE